MLEIPLQIGHGGNGPDKNGPDVIVAVGVTCGVTESGGKVLGYRSGRWGSALGTGPKCDRQEAGSGRGP